MELGKGQFLARHRKNGVPRGEFFGLDFGTPSQPTLFWSKRHQKIIPHPNQKHPSCKPCDLVVDSDACPKKNYIFFWGENKSWAPKN